MKPHDASEMINHITRREWLLRLGETVALAGVSGLLPETSLRLLAAEQQLAALPPGLYEPSSDELVHALSHKASPPPRGSETDYVQPGAPYKLQFFSAEEFRTITGLVSALLGDVDKDAQKETSDWVDLWFHSANGVRETARNLDPLHRTLAIAYFGENSVTQLETADPAATARQGLAELEKRCTEVHKKRFPELTTSEQKQMVRATRAADPKTALANFLELVRNEVIRGYYTSATGLKELDYKGNTYYPYCPGCPSTEPVKE